MPVAIGATTEGCVTATPRSNSTPSPTGVRPLELGDSGHCRLRGLRSRRSRRRDLAQDVVVGRHGLPRRTAAAIASAAAARGHGPLSGVMALKKCLGRGESKKHTGLPPPPAGTPVPGGFSRTLG